MTSFNYFDQSQETQQQLLEAATFKAKMNSSVLEKDLWVVLCLKALFSSIFRKNFIFKGGTSLSKAYTIIDRFSEDIDIMSTAKVIDPPCRQSY